MFFETLFAETFYKLRKYKTKFRAILLGRTLLQQRSFALILSNPSYTLMIIMSLKIEDIEKIAHLARLSPEVAMTKDFANRLQKVMELIAKIDQIDVADVEPLAHPATEGGQPLRRDVVLESSDPQERDKYLRLAPNNQGHAASPIPLYLVPKVIE